ncbi:MAG: hypothetical protein ACR5K7_00405 [Symbiopectobacterium sp.]
MSNILTKMRVHDVGFVLKAGKPTLPGYRTMRELIGDRDAPYIMLSYISTRGRDG